MRVFVYVYNLIIRNEFCTCVSNWMLPWTSGMSMVLTISVEPKNLSTYALPGKKLLQGSKSYSLQIWKVGCPSKRRCKTLFEARYFSATLTGRSTILFVVGNSGVVEICAVAAQNVSCLWQRLSWKVDG